MVRKFVWRSPAGEEQHIRIRPLRKETKNEQHLNQHASTTDPNKSTHQPDNAVNRNDSTSNAETTLQPDVKHPESQPTPQPTATTLFDFDSFLHNTDDASTLHDFDFIGPRNADPAPGHTHDLTALYHDFGGCDDCSCLFGHPEATKEDLDVDLQRRFACPSAEEEDASGASTLATFTLTLTPLPSHRDYILTSIVTSASTSTSTFPSPPSPSSLPTTISSISLSLNTLLANTNGRFTWSPCGNFGYSARNVRLSQDGKVLHAELCKRDGTWIDACVVLSEGVEVVGGVLRGRRMPMGRAQGTWEGDACQG